MRFENLSGLKILKIDYARFLNGRILENLLAATPKLTDINILGLKQKKDLYLKNSLQTNCPLYALETFFMPEIYLIEQICFTSNHFLKKI